MVEVNCEEKSSRAEMAVGHMGPEVKDSTGHMDHGSFEWPFADSAYEREDLDLR